MNYIVTLKIRNLLVYDYDKPPSLAVADIVPIPTAQGRVGTTIKGYILRLLDPASLAQPLEVENGDYEIQVKLPAGNILFVTVKIVGLNGGKSHLSFETDLPVPVISKFSDIKNNSIRAPRLSNKIRRNSYIKSEPIYCFNEFFGKDFFELSEKLNFFRVETSTDNSIFDGDFIFMNQALQGAFALFGLPIRLQEAKVSRVNDDYQASWKITMKNTPKKSLEGRERKRYYFLNRARNGRGEQLWLACIPSNWTALGENKRRSTTVKVVGYECFSEYGYPRVQIDDDDIVAMMNYVDLGEADTALKIIQPALQALFEKQNNPFAAAAGAYALLYASDYVEGYNWVRWVGNLANQFPGLPDGMILYSTLLLQTDLEPDLYFEGREFRHRKKRAYHAVMEALYRGPPLYRQGLRLLATNIDILQELCVEDSEALNLRAAAAVVYQWRLRVDPTQIFCVFGFASTIF